MKLPPDIFPFTFECQHDDEYFSLATEQGWRSLLAAYPGPNKSCELFCSVPTAGQEETKEAKGEPVEEATKEAEADVALSAGVQGDESGAAVAPPHEPNAS